MSGPAIVNETSPVCSRCGEPIGDICWPGIEGSTQCVSDGYFEEQGFGRPRLWFHTQCEHMKPLKRHLLPWVSILEQRRKQAA